MIYLCHNFAEEHLFSGKQVAGAIFNLKNNYGWVDRQELGVDTLTLEQKLAELESRRAERLAITHED